jgi:predicted MPP superfamily phosphohydrolase
MKLGPGIKYLGRVEYSKGAMVIKLLTLSDLHLDLAGHDPPKDLTGVDGVIVAGDISPGTSGLNWLLDKLPPYLKIIYVPGNHEYYKHNYPALLAKLRAQAKGTNVHVLNNEAVKLWGITFLGTTLWTDFLKGKDQSFWPTSARSQAAGLDGSETQIEWVYRSKPI